MFCENCGAKNKDEAKFCVKCGVSFGAIQKEEKISTAKVLKDELSQKGGGFSSFFEALFDFSFTEFVTTKIIKVLFGLSIAFNALIGLILIIISFSANVAVGILILLIVAPLIFLISVIYSRVLLEIIIVIYRIAEHTAEIAKKTGA